MCWLLTWRPLQRWNREKRCQGGRAVCFELKEFLGFSVVSALPRNPKSGLQPVLPPACSAWAKMPWGHTGLSHCWSPAGVPPLVTHKSHRPGHPWECHHPSLRDISVLNSLFLPLNSYKELAPAPNSSLSEAPAASPVWNQYLWFHREKAGGGGRAQFEFSSCGTAPCVYGKWKMTVSSPC